MRAGAGGVRVRSTLNSLRSCGQQSLSARIWLLGRCLPGGFVYLRSVEQHLPGQRHRPTDSRSVACALSFTDRSSGSPTLRIDVAGCATPACAWRPWRYWSMAGELPRDSPVT